MRIVFIADARSPITKNWIGYYVERGHEVHIISSYPCSPDEMPGANILQVPIAFSGILHGGQNGKAKGVKRKSLLTPLLNSVRSGATIELTALVRNWLSPLDLYKHTARVRDFISKVSPDVVHAMRIPFEGILAAKATPASIPLIISVWGNDFTLHARRYRLISMMTKQTLRRADALHCDCRRDLKLAESWGFDSAKESAVLPGAGGIQTEVFYPGPCDDEFRQNLQIPKNVPVVINPRGFRQYVRNEAFFKAIPLVLRKCPETIFVCSAMRQNPVAEKWVSQLNISRNVRLLPVVSRYQMSDLFRLAQVTVSPSVHDGTPNTLLEAIACGCFPVAGSTDSLREWIDDGVNGFLCDPDDPEVLAEAMIKVIEDAELRQRAKEHNQRIILQRAEYRKIMQESERFYERVIRRASN